MPEHITKGELVRVIARRTRLKGQEVQVLAIEHGTIRMNKYSDTWYLLDTRTPNHSTSFPAWFERHEIEPVTPEVGTLHYGYEEWERGLPPMPGPKEPDKPEESRGVAG